MFPSKTRPTLSGEKKIISFLRGTLCTSQGGSKQEITHMNLLLLLLLLLGLGKIIRIRVVVVLSSGRKFLKHH